MWLKVFNLLCFIPNLHDNISFTRWHFNSTFAMFCTCIGPHAEQKGFILGCKRGFCPIYLSRASSG